MLLRFWRGLKDICLFSKWKLLFGVGFLCLNVISILILSWNTSIVLITYCTFCWLSRLFLFLIIQYIHKFLKNLFVLNIHTCIHVLIILLKLLFGFISSCRILDILLRFLVKIVCRWRDGVFVFIDIYCRFIFDDWLRIFLGWLLWLLLLFLLLLICWVNVRFEKIWNVSDVLRFESLFI